MQVVDAVSSREPLVQRLEVANSLMLTFHGLRNANVRDGDTRLRLTMSAQVAAQLWRKLGEELTEAEENRLSSASSCQCWASDAQDDLGGTFHQRCEERLGPAVAWRMARAVSPALDALGQAGSVRPQPGSDPIRALHPVISSLYTQFSALVLGLDERLDADGGDHFEGLLS